MLRREVCEGAERWVKGRGRGKRGRAVEQSGGGAVNGWMGKVEDGKGEQ